MTNFRYGCCVVGGGPAGLMAAISAARRGIPTLVLEKLQAPGRRLLATGGGRCNLANTLSPKECAARFGARRGFVAKAMGSFPSESLRTFFGELGVPTDAEDGFHIFPRSQKASDILDALLGECRRLGVGVETSRQVRRILVESGRAVGIAGEDFEIRSAAVVLACGGMSCPALGGGDDFLRLAESAGHSSVAPVPALVGLDSSEKWLESLAGVVLKGVKAELLHASGSVEASAVGDLLFTGSGVSGPPILDLSGAACHLLSEGVPARLRLGLVRGQTEASLLNLIHGWRTSQARRTIRSLTAGLAPQSVVDALLAEAGIPPGLSAARLSKEDGRRLAALLSGVNVAVKGAAGGFGKAMATRGGIDTAEVVSSSMESRVLPGLSFAGEALDVDGPCGGFNLQWAFASGRLAGVSIVV